MLQEELRELISSIQKMKTEDGQIEIKQAEKGFPKIYDTLSSFSNQTGGGVILFGIREKPYEIVGVYDAADLMNKIQEQCLQMEPPIRAVCTATTITDKTVVSAEIPELPLTQRPCFYKGAGRLQGSYIRVGDGDLKMTPYEIYSYEAFKEKKQDELTTIDKTSIANLRTPFLEEYRAKLALSKPRFSMFSIEKTLTLQGFLLDQQATLAGIVLFADYPQFFFPRLCITAVVVPGKSMGDVSNTGARFIDNQTIEGTLPEMLEGALIFIRRNMKNETTINPITGLRIDRTEYPLIAIREILLNALIHRDYSIHTTSAPITVVMYTDRIEIENPGGLYGRLTLDRLGIVSADTRNPFIANAMEVAGATENRFSGIPTIRREMKLVQLPPPTFHNERGVFKVTLYNAAQVDSEVSERDELEKAILQFCKQKRTREELALHFPNISKIYLFSRYVNKLVDENLLILGLPDKPRSKFQTFESVR